MAWIAADLLAQAEHDPVAQSILLTTSAAEADAVAAGMRRTFAFGAVLLAAALVIAWRSDRGRKP